MAVGTARTPGSPEGRAILREAQIPGVELVETMDEAARRAAQLAVREVR